MVSCLAVNRRALGERVKALRQQQGWSQEEFARRLRVKRNTVNRWEMGERSPSLPKIERIAAELGVGVGAVLPELAVDQGRGALAVPAHLLAFDLRAIMGQAFTGPLLSLMAVVDDLRYLQRQLIVSQERLRAATKAERSVIVGESNYLFRAMCAALHEAESMFSRLEKHGRRVVEAAVGTRPRAGEALRLVRQLYQVGRSTKGKPFLEAVRNWVASHYDPQQLESQLSKGVKARLVTGAATMTQYHGLGRYTFIDEVTVHVIRRALRAPLRDFERRFSEKVGEVIALSEALATVVDDLAGYLVAKHSGEIHEEQSVLRVDPLIARARREIQAERGSVRTG
jgi:transcriptional regulator with XRE-family HTH domain